LFFLAAGGLTACPFPEDAVFKLTVNLRKILKRHGFGEGRSQEGDAEQLTDVRLMQALMTAFEDPDAYFCEWWAKGVWLGSPTRPLPRAPALYDRKIKWALKDEGDSLHGDWTTNYSSLRGHEEKVKAQYDAEVKDGLMAKISLGEALDRFGSNLIIAATAAIAKKGTGPDAEIRVIYDGTHGVFLNYGIRIRDQVRYPTAPDVKAMMAENYAEGGSHFQLVFDVSKAHRRVPVLEE
jgi:hypothetical protein